MKKLAVFFLYLHLGLSLFAQVFVTSGAEAISVALENSREQLYQQLMAQEQMKNARLSVQDFLPQLGVSYSESDAVNVGRADSRSKSLQFSVSQLIFDGGQAWNQYQLDKIGGLLNYEAYLQSLEEFKGGILDGYQGIVMQQKVVDIKKSLKEAGFSRLAVLAKELELGLAREIDYLEYLISCRKLEQEERLAQEALELQLESFRQNLGLAYGTKLIVENQEEKLDEQGMLEKIYPVFPHFEKIVTLSVDYSPALRQQGLEYEASVQQKKLESKLLVPNISLEGSMSLSGREFPLREPDFSLRIKVSFDRNTLFPASNSTSMGFDLQRLRSFGNSASGNLNPQLNYFSQKKLNSIALLQKQLSLEVSEEKLRDSLRELLLNFDNSYENYLFSKESLGIQQKKVEINWQKLENGEVTEMDYLQSLMELSTMEIQLVELESNLVSLLRAIELSAGISPGGLDEIL